MRAAQDWWTCSLQRYSLVILKQSYAEQKMAFKPLSILAASTFLLGVAAWYAARVWTFGHFQISYAIPLVLATALAVSQMRGSKSSSWLMGLFSAGGAYASFNLFFYINSKELVGGAYIIPGVLFSLCLTLLFSLLCAAYLRKGRSNE